MNKYDSVELKDLRGILGVILLGVLICVFSYLVFPPRKNQVVVFSDYSGLSEGIEGRYECIVKKDEGVLIRKCVVVKEKPMKIERFSIKVAGQGAEMEKERKIPLPLSAAAVKIMEEAGIKRSLSMAEGIGIPRDHPVKVGWKNKEE